MVFPYPSGVKTGPYYNAAVSILWPTLMVWTRRDWHGRENLGEPGQGLVVAANHMSWFDPMVICHFMNDTGRPPRFLAKDALFDLPVVGPVVGGAGQIPVHRETSDAAHAVQSAVTAVEEGEAVVVYPEGTLTRDPDLWPMSGKTGAARIALISGAPVIPLAHWGAQDVMRPYHKELKLFPPKTMHVAAGPPVNLDDLRPLEMDQAVLEEATTRILDAITALQADFRGEPVPTQRWSMKLGTRVPIVRGLAAQRAHDAEGQDLR
ncbi:MAG: 1-acyl-sn-glycerol-3-phosphate acyltransferase [Actinomycetia bacterium]|nr:1-acyl-sn-glycerol-3-phosphate acyltransferase [Actinomycetes bacterium]